MSNIEDSNITNTVTPNPVWKSKALAMVKMPYVTVPLMLIIITLLSSVVLGLYFIPWQQSISGAGKVMIFSPMDRPQNIEAQIPGRIIQWHTREGQFVKTGDLIVELSELDSKFLDPKQLARMESQKEVLQLRKSAAETRASALEQQITALSKSQNNALPAADERAKQALDRLKQSEQALEAARQNKLTAELNLKRLTELEAKGLRSKRDKELAELEYIRNTTEVERALAALEVSSKDTSIFKLDRMRLEGDTTASISSTKASLASAKETIASINNDLIKLEIDIQNLSGRIEQRKVTAPKDGRIVRLLRVGAGETVKAGDVLAVIAPDTNDLAVDFIISDNDAPLVSVGRQVRLQFAGWPALQFSGWPSIAVGTFAGKVSVIDATDDGKSNYRVIIVPDKEAIASGKEEPWPDSQHLRPGAQTVGFIMLDTVSLGFELWRQFNAFPPTVQRPLETYKEKKKDNSESKKEEDSDKK